VEEVPHVCNVLAAVVRAGGPFYKDPQLSALDDIELSEFEVHLVEALHWVQHAMAERGCVSFIPALRRTDEG
jgi:hypothetical protein